MAYIQYLYIIHYTHNDSTVGGTMCAPAQVNVVCFVTPTSQKQGEEQLQASM